MTVVENWNNSVRNSRPQSDMTVHEDWNTSVKSSSPQIVTNNMYRLANKTSIRTRPRCEPAKYNNGGIPGRHNGVPLAGRQNGVPLIGHCERFYLGQRRSTRNMSRRSPSLGIISPLASTSTGSSPSSSTTSSTSPSGSSIGCDISSIEEEEEPLPPTTTCVSPTDKEMATIIRTLRHHYLLKVYLPIYRLLHLQSRRNDRDEIRRKLAMGGGADEDYYGGERAFRKPNFQSRLQSGMNLQICFMNDAPPEDDSTAHSKQVRIKITFCLALFG